MRTVYLVLLLSFLLPFRSFSQDQGDSSLLLLSTVVMHTSFNEGTVGTTFIGTSPAIDIPGSQWVKVGTGGNTGAVFATGGGTFGPATAATSTVLIDTGQNGQTTPKTIALHGVTITGTNSFQFYLQVNGSSGVGPTHGIFVDWQHTGGQIQLIDAGTVTTTLATANIGSTQSGDITFQINGQSVIVNFFGTVLSGTVPSGSPSLTETMLGFNPNGDLGGADTDTVTVNSINVLVPASSETIGNLGEYDFDASGTTGLTPTGTPTLDSANAYTAPNAAHFNAASEYYTAPLGTTVTSLWTRAYVKVNTLSTSGTDELFDLYSSSGAQQLSIYLNTTDGHLSYFNQNTSSGGACVTTTYPTGSYHYVEFNWTASTTAGTLAVRFDGASTNCNLTGINTGSLGVAKVRFGQGAANAGWDLDLDNVGFSSTGWLGPVNQSAAPSDPGAPTIPSGAISANLLTGTWKPCVHDAGTPGAATCTNYANGTFPMTYTGAGGVRWATTFASDTTSTNYVLDGQFQSADWSHVANLELDDNQVKANGKTSILGTQCSTYSKTWEVTLINPSTGSWHWVPTNVACDPTKWTPNVMHHVRIFGTIDASGVSTYTGVEWDGAYSAFTGATGTTAESLGWAVGSDITNVQIDGLGTSGSATITSSNLTIYRW